MTNLTASSGSVLFSRERILTAVPLLIGSLTAGFLVVGQLLPTIERGRALDARLMRVGALERQLPAMRQRLRAANRDLQKAKNQQALLLDLIAGADRIQTFLSLVDQLARDNKVVVMRFEPLDELSDQASEVQPPAGQQRTLSKQQITEQREDSMLSIGYRKTSIALQIFGPYENLQRFLKGMESLEIVVESSELALSSRQMNSDAKDQRQMTGAELSVRLSFYDRQPQEAGMGDSTRTEKSMN